VSSLGIIAAAVYVEGSVSPYTVTLNVPYTAPFTPYWGDYTYSTIVTNGIGSGGTFSSFGIIPTVGTPKGAATDSNVFDVGCYNNVNATSNYINFDMERSLESKAACGAGEYTPQRISYVQGLTKPMLHETVRVRYLWWDHLVAKLKEHNVASPHGSGFPADQRVGIDLGTTPRIGSYEKPAFPREQTQSQPVYQRV
jgi:hypothetical protein